MTEDRVTIDNAVIGDRVCHRLAHYLPATEYGTIDGIEKVGQFVYVNWDMRPEQQQIMVGSTGQYLL